ncbi:hypothetical protein [Flavobacterium selenitireducens]|uniref:hypothetical protein n=1 Tax=Flavobacterium selenitireducens TaxID=2722704 RepID=UPI00168AD013|nr:hypothetical protein [Flavobacterium selenitireducens]MBD3581831.1 hypothetical protein [Flavobacterium selenitireducens]
MRFVWLLFVFFSLPVLAQVLPETKMASEYRQCTSKKCRLKTSFSLAEYYMEADQIAKSQQWLEITKELNRVHARDTMSYYI